MLASVTYRMCVPSGCGFGSSADWPGLLEKTLQVALFSKNGAPAAVGGFWAPGAGLASMRHKPLAESDIHRWPVGLPSGFNLTVVPAASLYSGSQMPSFGRVTPEPYRVPTFCDGGGGGVAGRPGWPIASAGAPGAMRHRLPLKALAPAEGSSPRYMALSGDWVGVKAKEYWRVDPSGKMPKFE